MVFLLPDSSCIFYQLQLFCHIPYLTTAKGRSSWASLMAVPRSSELKAPLFRYQDVHNGQAAHSTFPWRVGPGFLEKDATDSKYDGGLAPLCVRPPPEVQSSVPGKVPG